MPRFIVTERVEYEVEAADGDEAGDKVVGNARRDQWCVGVPDRWWDEVPKGQPSRLAPRRPAKRQ